MHSVRNFEENRFATSKIIKSHLFGLDCLAHFLSLYRNSHIFFRYLRYNTNIFGSFYNALKNELGKYDSVNVTSGPGDQLVW